MGTFVLSGKFRGKRSKIDLSYLSYPALLALALIGKILASESAGTGTWPGWPGPL